MAVQSSLSNKYTWEVGPLRLLEIPITDADQLNRAAIHTALTCNCLIRALNSIYHQTPHVPCTHHKTFVNYSLSVYYALLDVLSGESVLDAETWRYISEKKYTARVLPSDWGQYLESIWASKDTFSPAICMSLLKEFFPRLNSHFANQIDNYNNFDDFTKRGWDERKVFIDFVALADDQIAGIARCLGRGNKRAVFWTNHDSTGNMDLPQELRSFIGISKWFNKKCEVWQFSTCDFDGNPRELKFLGKKE
jgi:hypothetical protein